MDFVQEVWKQKVQNFIDFGGRRIPSTSQQGLQITKGITKIEKMQSSASLKPKARQRYIHYRRHNQPPARTPDHHYFRPLSLQEHRWQKQKLPWDRRRPSSPLVPHRPVVGVIDDDYLAVTRRPEDVAVEVAKKLSGEFLIARSVNNKRRRAAHWGCP
jgi:hypothetical protein